MTNLRTVRFWNRPIPSRVIITRPYHRHPASSKNRVIIINHLIITNAIVPINPSKAIIDLIIIITLLFTSFPYTCHFIKSICSFVF